MSILETKLMKWSDIFNDISPTGVTALTSEMETAIRTTVTTIPTRFMAALNMHIIQRNRGLSMFVKKDSAITRNEYSNTFSAFIYANANRLKFSYLTQVDGLNKTRTYTYTEKADGLKNYEKQGGTVTSNRDTTGTTKGGFYSETDEYISDIPKYENITDHNGTTTTDNTKNKYIDIAKTENETIVDPYSFVHLNDFINGYRTFLSIIDEYYDEWTCPLR